MLSRLPNLYLCGTLGMKWRHATVTERERKREGYDFVWNFDNSILSQRPSLWSSRQSSWLQIQRSGFDSRRYQILWEVVGLERGPLSLVSTTEELLERKSSGSAVESRYYGSTDPSRWPRGNLYPQTLALTSPTSVSRLVGIVRLRVQVTEFSFFSFICS
jgi:hypothetical protein